MGAGGSESSPASSRRGSTSPRAPWSSTQRRWPPAVSAPLPRPSPSVTSSSEVSLSGGPALMIHSGDPVNEYVDMACRHVLLRQGVLGIKVKIMLPWDPSGKIGPKKPLPDHVSIVEPKEETLPPNPFSETKAAKPNQPPVHA